MHSQWEQYRPQGVLWEEISWGVDSWRLKAGGTGEGAEIEGKEGWKASLPLITLPDMFVPKHRWAAGWIQIAIDSFSPTATEFIENLKELKFMP